MNEDEAAFVAAIEAGNFDIDLARRVLRSQEQLPAAVCLAIGVAEGATFNKGAERVIATGLRKQYTGGVVG